MLAGDTNSACDIVFWAELESVVLPTDCEFWLYGSCRWLIGHEGKISSVGGLAARYPAAAYIQMELKALSIALFSSRGCKNVDKERRQKQDVGELWDHTIYAAS
jgi:hypothetical protein